MFLQDFYPDKVKPKIKSDIFVAKSKGLKNSTKNIKATLQLFGYIDRIKPWFISSGSGIERFPEESFRSDFYVYLICMNGKAQLWINNELQAISPNSLLSLIPSTLVQVKNHSLDFRAKVLVFERSFLLKNILDARQLEHLGFFSFTSITHLQLTKNESQKLNRMVDYLYERSLQDGIFHDQVMQSLIFNLLFETAAIYSDHHHQQIQKAVSREEELFIQFMKLVQSNFNTQQTLSYYGNKLFISDKYLIQICKNITGKTPGTIMAELMINEAKLLLNNPANNINLVSQKLNYATVAAFSKFFKKHTGVSPSKWNK